MSTLVPGIRGNAYAFAGGAEEFIQLPAISTNLLTDRPFTLTLWSNAMPLTNASILVSKTFDPVDDKNVASLLISFAGGLLFETTSTGLDYAPLAFNTPSIEDGVWHHLAVRWNGTTKSAFVDGVLLGTTDAVIADSEQPVRIGADLDRLATVLTHKGLLDDIRFYRRALTDDEVLTISSVP